MCYNARCHFVHSYLGWYHPLVPYFLLERKLSQETQEKVHCADIGVPTALFYGRDRNKLIEEFIKFPGIVQVGMFGSLVQHGIGQELSLVLVVDDETLFLKYLDLVNSYQDRTQYRRSAKQVRLAAFDVLFGRHRPKWEQCLAPERDLKLRLYTDLVVLPFNWQHRVEEIEPMLKKASSVSMTEICRTVCFYKTEV